MTTKPRNYLYTFIFDSKTKLEFSVALDARSLTTITCPAAPPKWAKLEHHQCEPCTLNEKDSPYCPVGLSMVELVSAFGQTPSYTPCTVICRTPDRTVSKETVVQEGLSSILGLLMPTSGCPVMSFFKPLARFHLPFSTIEEASFRVAGSYFLRQYFNSQDDPNAQYQLADIRKQYALVKKVNIDVLARIRDINELDADKNGIVTLNSLAQILELEIDTNLESIKYIFS